MTTTTDSKTRTIDGKTFVNDMLDLAETCTKDAGDGRISTADANKMLALVKDGSKYTDIEKQTMEYIRANFKWTDQADEWFRTEVRKWASSN